MNKTSLNTIPRGYGTYNTVIFNVHYLKGKNGKQAIHVLFVYQKKIQVFLCTKGYECMASFVYQMLINTRISCIHYFAN